jgi:hypothetical protein
MRYKEHTRKLCNKIISIEQVVGLDSSVSRMQILGEGGYSVYATLLSLVFTIYLIATCFGHTTIFTQKYIC